MQFHLRKLLTRFAGLALLGTGAVLFGPTGCDCSGEAMSDADGETGERDAPIGDGAAYDPGDARPPEAPCETPVERLVVELPRFLEGQRGGGSVLADGPGTLMVAEDFERALLVRTLELSTGLTHDRLVRLADGGWVSVAIASRPEPRVLLWDSVDQTRLAWVVLGADSDRIAPLVLPPEVSGDALDPPLTGFVPTASAFSTVVAVAGQPHVMRVTETGIELRALDSPSGTTRFSLAGYGDSIVVMAVGGTSVQLAVMDASGLVLEPWRAVFDTMSIAAPGQVRVDAGSDWIAVTRFEGSTLETSWRDPFLGETARNRLSTPLDLVWAGVLGDRTRALVASLVREPAGGEVGYGTIVDDTLEGWRRLADGGEVLHTWVTTDHRHAVALETAESGLIDVFLLCADG